MHFKTLSLFSKLILLIIYIYTHTYALMCVHGGMFMYVYIYIYIYMAGYVWTYIYIYVCVCAVVYPSNYFFVILREVFIFEKVTFMLISYEIKKKFTCRYAVL